MDRDLLDILMITYDRPEYTRRSLERLLETCTDQMRVWVWHNGNDPETLDVVRSLIEHPRIHRFHNSPENVGLEGPTNWLWSNADGAYVSKVDDDCLVPDNWAEELIEIHRRNSRVGAVGCWRFYDEDFVPRLAEKKIVKLNGDHRLMQNCWVQGSSYVLKRRCIEAHGLLDRKTNFTLYCIKLALAGWINGWRYPFLHEEHMDDPRSPYTTLKTDADFTQNRPLSAVVAEVASLAEWANRVRYMARSAQEASLDPRQHVGWRKKIRGLGRRMKRVIGVRERWRLS